MALLENEKTNVIRHLGYEVIGRYQNAPSGGSLAAGNLGYRYFDRFYSTLVARLDQLKPDEEARIAGRAYGGVAFTGLEPQPGDIVNVTCSNGGLPTPITSTVTVPARSAIASPWNLLTVAAALAQNFALQPAFGAAGYMALADYGSGAWTQTKPATPITSILAPPNVQQFTIGVSYTGTTAPQIYATGVRQPPYMSFRQAGTVINLWGYLPILDYLEAAYLGSSINMSTNKTKNVELRPDEADQRSAQYDKYRADFGNWLGIPVNPNPKSALAGGGSHVGY